MSNNEITLLKEELFKEIHNIEDKLNVQMLVKSNKMEENNNKFKEEFNNIFKRGKALLDLMSEKIIYLDKINDLESFKKKADDIIITHEIRINNNMKDIEDIKFKYDKEIKENLRVPGFIGPSCQYKTISSYIYSNISELSKIKNENEFTKKENKEIKKKLDEMVKTVLNLVDNTNKKYIEYVNNKTNNLHELINNKIQDFSEKIIEFKCLLMTQKKTEEFQENIIKKLKNKTYRKEEIDEKIKEIIDILHIDLENFKIKCSNDIDSLIKENIENVENEIKEIKKAIKEIKIKIHKINQTQNQLIQKNNSLIKSIKTNEKSLVNNNIIVNNNNYNSNNGNNSKNISPKKKINDEEKLIKAKNFDINGNSKTIDSLDELRYKNNNEYNMTETNINKENKILSKIKKLKKNENTPTEHLRNGKKDLLIKYKLENDKVIFRNENFNNVYSEENKNPTINNKIENDLNLSITQKKNSNNKLIKIEKEENNKYNSPYNNKNKNLAINNSENNNKNYNNLFKKTENNFFNNEKIINLKSKKNNRTLDNLSNFLCFGMSNHKTIISSIENEENNKNINSSSHIVKLIRDDYFNKNKIDNKDNESSNNINLKKINKKTGQNYLHKLTSLGFEEKDNKFLPIMNEFLGKNLEKKNKKIVSSSLVKNIFNHSYQMKQKNINSYQNLSSEVPVKIQAAFGRTGYAFYDRKEEAINNLINKKVKNKNKRNNFYSTNINFRLSPSFKIKVYDNI